MPQCRHRSRHSQVLASACPSATNADGDVAIRVIFSPLFRTPSGLFEARLKVCCTRALLTLVSNQLQIRGGVALSYLTTDPCDKRSFQVTGINVYGTVMHHAGFHTGSGLCPQISQRKSSSDSLVGGQRFACTRHFSARLFTPLKKLALVANLLHAALQLCGMIFQEVQTNPLDTSLCVRAL
jgi:hypothetical protein